MSPTALARTHAEPPQRRHRHRPGRLPGRNPARPAPRPRFPPCSCSAPPSSTPWPSLCGQDAISFQVNAPTEHGPRRPRHPVGRPQRTAGTPARYCRRRAPGGRRQREHRRCRRGLLPDASRINGLAGFQSVDAATPLRLGEPRLVHGPFTVLADLHRRPQPRPACLRPRRLRCHRRQLPPDRPQRLPGRRRPTLSRSACCSSNTRRRLPRSSPPAARWTSP